MKLFRPLLFAVAALAFACVPLIGITPGGDFFHPPSAMLTTDAATALTNAVVADVMKVAVGALALLSIVLAVVAIVLRTRRRSVAYPIDRRIPFHDPWWPYPTG
jgi:hypothetical protein